MSIFLLVPPKITDISPNTTVNEGDSLTLTCLATGNPTANITWTKDNNFVDFPLDSIDKGGTGTYQCLANNGVGRPATAYVFVTVQCKYYLVLLTFSVFALKQCCYNELYFFQEPGQCL